MMDDLGEFSNHSAKEMKIVAKTAQKLRGKIPMPEA